VSKLFEYSELTKRNWPFLDEKQQAKIKQTKILFAGCGLGANIAKLATSTGFTNFILADGDRVEVSNLNRQCFNLNQVGLNKAIATSQIIKQINPECTIEIFDQYITTEDVARLVDKVDFVINTVDFNSPTILRLNDYAQKSGKKVFFPIDIGWGSRLFVFSPRSISLEQFLDFKGDTKEILPKLLLKIAPTFPDYLLPLLNKHQDIYRKILEGANPIPQVGIAVWTSSVLTVMALILSALGFPIKEVPEIITLDIFSTIKI
jgi:molybdopterin/thiamine biosynthesis adenylyltransferase